MPRYFRERRADENDIICVWRVRDNGYLEVRLQPVNKEPDEEWKPSLTTVKALELTPGIEEIPADKAELYD